MAPNGPGRPPVSRSNSNASTPRSSKLSGRSDSMPPDRIYLLSHFLLLFFKINFFLL